MSSLSLQTGENEEEKAIRETIRLYFRGDRDRAPEHWKRAFHPTANRPLTADKRPVPAYFWSEDSKYVLYVQDKGGNENYHVYAVDATAPPEETTGVPPARDLTPY